MFSTFMGRRRREQKETKLLITPMMDMFTIILVFLLLSFAPDDPVAIKDVELAQSTREEPLKDAIRVAVTPDALLVQGVRLAGIAEGAIADVRVEGKRIIPLYDVLRKLKGERLAELERRGEDRTGEDAVLVLMVDKSVPYSVLDPVLKTAAEAGFPNARYGVLRGAAPTVVQTPGGGGAP